MSDLRTIFNDYNKVIENSEIGNYFPPKSYIDVAEIRQQKLKAEKKYMKDQGHKKLDLKCKKGTFLEQIQKRQSRLPSPSTYKPEIPVPGYKNNKMTNLPSRSTHTNDIIKQCKKQSFPSPTQYEPLKHRSSSMASFSKADKTNYIDNIATTSSEKPGIGEYNVTEKQEIKLGKWDKSNRQIKSKENFLPGVGTYHPRYPSQTLFCQIESQNKSKSKSKLGLEKRFDEKITNGSKKMFYCGVSEWGVNENNRRKDILSMLSTHNIYSKSVYYR